MSAPACSPCPMARVRRTAIRSRSVKRAPAPSPSLSASRRLNGSIVGHSMLRVNGWCGLTVLSSSAWRSARNRREWWQSYFDAQYLLEYEPLFSLERDRRRSRAPARRARAAVRRAYARRALRTRTARASARRSRFRRRRPRLLAGLLARARRARHRPASSLYARRHAQAARAVERTLRRGCEPLHLVRLLHRAGATIARHRRVRARARPGECSSGTAANRDGVMARFLGRDWWIDAQETLVAQERTFDPLSGILVVTSVWSGPGGRGSRPSHPPLLADAVG